MRSQTEPFGNKGFLLRVLPFQHMAREKDCMRGACTQKVVHGALPSSYCPKGDCWLAYGCVLWVPMQVIRHYHGHLSGCYALALHPKLDLLMTGGRDSVCRVWDMRTKV